MNLVLELNEIAENLDEKRLALLVDVAKNFLVYSEEFPDDLHYINLAKQERQNGENHQWSDINWD